MVHYRNIIRRIACTLLMLGSVQLSHAQEPNTRSIDFSCVTWERMPDEKVFYRDGADYLPLEVGFKRRSKLQPLSSGHVALELFVKGMDVDGQIIFQLVGTAPILVGTDRMLFFVQPALENASGTPLAVVGIDDSLSSFPVGSFRFVNATPAPLQILLNGTKGKVSARGITVIQPDVPELGGFMPVYIGDSENDVIFESRFFAQPSGRKLVIIRPPETPDGKIRLRFLSEIVVTSLPKE